MGNPAYSRMHNHTDDLRSYEQAVLARRAPLTLHLAPRPRGNTKGNRANPAGSGGGGDRSMSGSDSRASAIGRVARKGLKMHSGLRSNGYRRRHSVPSIRSGRRLVCCPPHTGFPGVVDEQEQNMQEWGLGGISERSRRMSFPSGRTGLVGQRIDWHSCEICICQDIFLRCNHFRFLKKGLLRAL
jgi:hypothetical protein